MMSYSGRQVKLPPDKTTKRFRFGTLFLGDIFRVLPQYKVLMVRVKYMHLRYVMPCDKLNAYIAYYRIDLDKNCYRSF